MVQTRSESSSRFDLQHKDGKRLPHGCQYNPFASGFASRKRLLDLPFKLGRVHGVNVGMYTAGNAALVRPVA